MLIELRETVSGHSCKSLKNASTVVSERIPHTINGGDIRRELLNRIDMPALGSIPKELSNLGALKYASDSAACEKLAVVVEQTVVARSPLVDRCLFVSGIGLGRPPYTLSINSFQLRWYALVLCQICRGYNGFFELVSLLLAHRDEIYTRAFTLVSGRRAVLHRKYEHLSTVTFLKLVVENIDQTLVLPLTILSSLIEEIDRDVRRNGIDED